MDNSEEPFWNLDQLRAWALSRNKEAAKKAALPKTGIVTDTPAAINAATCRAAATAARNGRDINEELWNASGWRKCDAPARFRVDILPIAPAIQILMDELDRRGDLDKQLVDIAIKARGTPTESLHFGILDDGLRALVGSALDAPPAHGPFRQIVYFPINDFLLRLFRLGRLTAFVDRPDGSGARALTLAEWAVLSIDWFGDPQRRCAVRPTLRSVAQVREGGKALPSKE